MENIQHPTSNIQPRTPQGARLRAFFGGSALDVGCWMFLEVHGAAAQAISRGELDLITKGKIAL
jgi:hypothetical protein